MVTKRFKLSETDIEEQEQVTTKRLKMTPRIELVKHRNNVKEVLLCSNATPIRRYGSIGYMCCYCDDQYTEPILLKKHTLENHKDVTQANFMKHMNMSEYVVKLDITDLTCKLCDRQILSLENMLDHLRTVHNRNIFFDIRSHIFPFKFDSDMLKCMICSNAFNKFRMLVKHMHIHYRNYICTICDSGFVNRNILAQHSDKHKTGEFTCDYCPKVYNTQLKRKQHERTVHTHADLINKCGYCTKTFKDYRRKEAHLTEVHGVQISKSTCQACEKVFSNRKLLSIHIKRDHLMERPHKCPECEMNFFSTTGLKNHMVKHTGAKEFQCTVCSKFFGRKKTLNSHMRIHDEVRRYKCEHCGQAFVQKCSWRTHMRLKHEEIV